MTKGRVAVGKIESWMRIFPACIAVCIEKPQQEQKYDTAISQLQAISRVFTMSFRIQHLLRIWLVFQHLMDLRFRHGPGNNFNVLFLAFHAYC
jgi:hypothetical protein